MYRSSGLFNIISAGKAIWPDAFIDLHICVFTVYAYNRGYIIKHQKEESQMTPETIEIFYIISTVCAIGALNYATSLATITRAQILTGATILLIDTETSSNSELLLAACYYRMSVTKSPYL